MPDLDRWLVGFAALFVLLALPLGDVVYAALRKCTGWHPPAVSWDEDEPRNPRFDAVASTVARLFVIGLGSVVASLAPSHPYHHAIAAAVAAAGVVLLAAGLFGNLAMYAGGRVSPFKDAHVWFGVNALGLLVGGGYAGWTALLLCAGVWLRLLAA